MDTKGVDAAGMAESLRKAADVLRLVLDGEKPFLDPADPETGWLYEQLTRLHARFLLPEEAKCYVTLPGEGGEVVPFKGNTSFHAVGYPLTESAQTITRAAEIDMIPNVAVLGYLPQFRDTAKDPREMSANAGGLVLGKSDIYGLWQALEGMQAHMEGGLLDAAPVVINNHKDIWSPLIRQYRLNRADNPLAGKVVVAETLRGITDALRTAGNPRLTNSEAFEVPQMLVPGSTILVQTSNDKKIHELRAIMQAMGVAVQVLPFNIIVDKPLEAKEESATYAGNCLEKKEKADEKTDSLPRAEIEGRLRAYGADPSKTFVLWDDRGLDTTLPLAGTEEFGRCGKFLNEYRQGPGVELANILKAMSLSDMYANFRIIAEREGMDTGKIMANDVTCYMLSDLFPDTAGERRTIATFGITYDRVIFEPRPATASHMYSENFLVPAEDTKGRTKAEIPSYIETRSCMALAAAALVAQTGIKLPEPALEQEQAVQLPNHFNFSSAHKWHGHKVASHASLFADMHGHGHKYVTKRLRDYFTFLSGGDGKYDYRKSKPYMVRGRDTGKHRIVHSNLNAFQTYQEDADAFLFGPLPARQRDSEEMFIDKLFSFTSLVVGKQVFDPAVYSKFWGIYGHEWDDCRALFDDFHRMGFIGQKPEHVYTAIADDSKRGIVSSVVGALNKAFTSYRRLTYTEPHYMEKGVEPKGLFRVTIYCSATSTDQVLRKDAFDLSYKLAAGGFAVKNGGGTEGLMVETSNGVHAYRREAQRNGLKQFARNAIISDQYEYTRRAEGLCEWNDYVRVHPTIFQRLEKLQDTDAEIVLAGGAGTIQEIVASLRTRLNGTRPVQHRPLVIVNQKVGRKGFERGVYDKLLQMLPLSVMKACNVHVVDNVDAAYALISMSRNAMGMKPQYTVLANDALPLAAPTLKTIA